MTPDSNGILYLEETDPITPFQTTINALQAATSAAILDAQIWEIPGGHLVASSNQAIPNGTVTNLTLDTTVALRGGMTIGPSGLIVPRDGWYTITGSVRWAGNTSGSRQLRLQHNGSPVLSDVIIPPAGGVAHSISLSMYCEAGDEISVSGYQSSGGNLDTSVNFGSPHLSVVWNGA